MENEKINFNLLIAKKENAEAYKSGIEEIKKEIEDMKSTINLSMIDEEKDLLKKQKEQKELELKELESTYETKRANVTDEINIVKEELSKYIEETEKKLISEEEFEKLEEQKANKEAELLECEKDIREVKDSLKELIDKDGGYEQDTVSLSEKLDNLTAYRTYIKEEIEELDTKLDNAFVIEDNIEELKYIKYMKMRMVNLSYDSIEKWVEDEKKFQEELIENDDPPKQDPPRQDPPKQDPPKQDPPRQDPPKQDPPKQDPPKQDPPKQDPPRQDPPRQDPPKTVYKWHDKLTPEQIEDAISRGIYEAEGQEYEQFLKEHGIDINKTNSGKKDKDNDIKLTRIFINTLKDEVGYHFTDNSVKFGATGVMNGLIYDGNSIKSTLKVLEQFGPEQDWKSVAQAIDPNIVELIAKTSGEKANEQLARYFKTLSGEKTDLSITYNLKDMYNSKFDYKQIKNITKIAKEASKKSLGTIKVEKDSLLKRAFGSIKKRIEYASQKLLTERKEEKIKNLETKSNESKTKTKVIDKLKARLPKREKTEKSEKRTNVISEAKTKAVSLGRETLGGLKIAGTKLSGYFKGEDNLITENKVRAIREKKFVPKAKVDEKAAIEKVEAPKENSEAEKTTDFNFIID